ncbi:MAG TPA: hypothetical protein VG938_11735 [Verrucomicrobiae bacterium]|jgi:hypothetical protein|nr:hypothetical protein [Verrucomicrobiae bacterium]
MSRAVFILVTGFWLTMNVLLWQTEFGSRKNTGAVPVRLVWEKILTAADDSSLTVFHGDKLVGACHLQTEVGEEWSKIGDDNMPTGRPTKGRGYRLRLDGSVVVPELTNRFRFEGDLKLDKRRNWQDVSARLTMRPYTWEIHSLAADQNLHFSLQGGLVPINMVVRFADLRNPAALTSELLGPMAGEVVEEIGGTGNPSAMALGVKWDAREDSLRIGHTLVQVYRLHTRLMDRYEISAIVSRAGEILRVDLPGEFVLVNDRLATTGEGAVRTPKTKVHARRLDAPVPE